MILDKLENLYIYKSSILNLDEIIKFIQTNNIVSMKEGKYDIVKKSVFIIIQDYLTKPKIEKKWESHKKYIDIQIMLKGSEYIGYSSIDKLNIEAPYNNEKDLIFYHNDKAINNMLFLPQNYFMVFLPNDAHMPGICVRNESNFVKKAVIKILIN